MTTTPETLTQHAAEILYDILEVVAGIPRDSDQAKYLVGVCARYTAETFIDPTPLARYLQLALRLAGTPATTLNVPADLRIGIDVYQDDGIEAFAAYLTPSVHEGRALVGLNISANLIAMLDGAVTRAELPYLLAEHLAHEVFHVLEDWCGVAFSEERVEALVQRYAAAARAETAHDEPLTDGPLTDGPFAGCDVVAFPHGDELYGA